MRRLRLRKAVETRTRKNRTLPSAVLLPERLSHLGDQPFAEALDLRHHSTLARISKPVSPSACRDPISKGHAQAAGRDIAFPKQRRQQRKSLPCHRGMALVRLVLEPDAGTAEHQLIGRHAVVAKPLLPPVVARIDAILMGEVRRLQGTAKLPLDERDAVGTGHRGERRFEKSIFLQPLPAAISRADRDVGVSAPHIAKLVAGRHSNGKVRVFHLKSAETPREPGVGKRVRRRDRQQRFVFLAVARKSRLDGVKRTRERRQQALAERRQTCPALFTDEERRTKTLLQALHLVGNCGLGHAELGGCRSKVFRPRGSLESPDRREWWKAPHQLTS